MSARIPYSVIMLALQHTLRPIERPELSPIFVIGTGRSGTTLLRQMLNAHPRIHITHEAAFYSYAWHAPKDISADEWFDLYADTFSFAWMRLDPEQIRRAFPRNLSMHQLREVFLAIMKAKAMQEGKVRFGEKNPLDTQNLGQIFSDFPDARVISIMRDPRPTVYSFNRMPFGTTSTMLNAQLCRVQFAHIKPFLDRILEVRLEDLTRDPRQIMQSILHFVGEPWDDAVLDHVQRSQTDDVPPMPWFVGATKRNPNQRESGVREELTPAWTRIIEWVNREAMEHYGYERAPLAHEPSLFDYAWTLGRDIKGIAEATYRLLAMKRLIDRHFQGKERLDPQRGMEENVRLNPPAWQHYPSFSMPQVPRLEHVSQNMLSP